ncbi:sodium:proton antiporter [Acidibrevibacterium fodinaquatile]|uniref:sodium:proton antiporter n=1 Tax=Acidibrevibacterium fodinaquatile TaxID=1969806 RepID=UPI0013B4483D|nr:sodium:proton antiporter [Acidibrevibacterium fodinaquatile]
MQPPPLLEALPFAGLLLSIALFPMVAPRFWHRRLGAIAAFWSLLFLFPLAAHDGLHAALTECWSALLTEYLPFVSVLLALYATTGGMLIRGGPGGTPASNTAWLAVGTLLAGVIGTTGASMVLIRPLLRANAHRAQKIHIVIALILLIGNAGGALSPLGDPPLYLGFLQGVPFFWPLRHLALPLLVFAAPVLAGFYLLDRRSARAAPPPEPRGRLRLRGRWHLLLIALINLTVLGQAIWHPGTVRLFGAAIDGERLAASLLFLALAGLASAITPLAVREANLFEWAPLVEIAKLFPAIFITITPVLALLATQTQTPLSATANFWGSGLASAFLDNAPTYLIFFRQAGGEGLPSDDALRAISAGAVLFGGLTYIGNAPNMMIRTIAAQRGIRMPRFFGYTGLAALALAPALGLVWVVFFR